LFSRGAVTVARVRGIPLRLHWSAILPVPLLVAALAVNAAPLAEAAGLPPEDLLLPGWAFGLLAAAGLEVSIALHEFSHSLVAIRHGGRVDSIVLMALGGVSQIERMPGKPRHELWMALAGPLCSLALAVLGATAWATLALAPPVAFFAFVFAYLNLALGVFNLLPAFPMDGGRVLRAGLSGFVGPRRATRIAAAVGQGFALGFALVAFLGGGLWLLLIAFFVWMAAAQERTRSDLAWSLRDLRVGDVVTTVPVLPPETSLEDARVILRDARADSALVVEDHRPVGVLRRLDVAGRDLRERMATPVRDAMVRLDALESADQLGLSFDRVLREGEVPVVDEGGGPLGVVRSDRVLAELAARDERFRGVVRPPGDGNGR
jgi:Zn-dependent protease/CBS domain-containing protein